MSLLDAAERFAATDRSRTSLDADRCLHARDRHSACKACFEMCPTAAIVPGKPPVLDADKCQICLSCLTVCPTGAFSADDAVTALLNSVAHLDGSALELVCAKNPAPEKGALQDSTGIRVRGCLAGLGTGTYIALVALGLEHIAVRTEACTGCEWGNLQVQIDEQIRKTKRFLSAWDKADCISAVPAAEQMVPRPLWNADNPPLSRRDLFRMIARQGSVAMARAMENGPHPTGHRPGRERFRILRAVACLPAPPDQSAIELEELGFAMVTVSEACTACGACARACPTNALEFEKDSEEKSFMLKFAPGNCVACDFCARVCVPAALTIDRHPAFAAIFGTEHIALQEGILVKCQSCGALTSKRGEQTLCDVCERKWIPPASMMTPAGSTAQSASPAQGQP